MKELKVLMDKTGATQADIARILKIKQPMVHKYVSGDSKMSFEKVKILINHFNAAGIFFPEHQPENENNIPSFKKLPETLKQAQEIINSKSNIKISLMQMIQAFHRQYLEEMQKEEKINRIEKDIDDLKNASHCADLSSQAGLTLPPKLINPTPKIILDEPLKK